MTEHGLPTSVLWQAAEAVAKEREPYYWSVSRDRHRLVRSSIPHVLAALPILTPAIREQSVRPLRDWYEGYIRDNYPPEWDQKAWREGDRPTGIIIPIDLIESILAPTATEGADQ